MDFKKVKNFLFEGVSHLINLKHYCREIAVNFKTYLNILRIRKWGKNEF